MSKKNRARLRHINPGSKHDVNLKTTSRTPTLCFYQKEKEILEKIRTLVDTDAPIRFKERKKHGNVISGELYRLVFCSEQMYHDLVSLGFDNNKSLTAIFPRIPDKFLRHFIRGCWDGDGSIWINKQGKPCASFVGGSYDFIASLVEKLSRIGISKRTIYKEERSKNPSYSIKLFSEDCRRLYNYMYYAVPESNLLERKYLVFKSAFGEPNFSEFPGKPDNPTEYITMDELLAGAEGAKSNI